MTLKFNSTSDDARSASPTAPSPLHHCRLSSLTCTRPLQWPWQLSWAPQTFQDQAEPAAIQTPMESHIRQVTTHPKASDFPRPNSDPQVLESKWYNWRKSTFMEMFTDTTLKNHTGNLCPAWKKCKKYPWNQGARLSGSQWHQQGPGWILGQLINCWKSGLSPKG